MNHRLHSGPAEVSTTWRHGRKNSMPRSSPTAGQNHSGSATERAWSDASESNPKRRIRRVTLACSTTSGAGAQQTAPEASSSRPTLFFSSRSLPGAATLP